MRYELWHPTPLLPQGMKKKRSATAVFILEAIGEEKDGDQIFEK